METRPLSPPERARKTGRYVVLGIFAVGLVALAILFAWKPPGNRARPHPVSMTRPAE